MLKKFYLPLLFSTITNELPVVIRKSRGKKVLEEILGKEPEGANSADGWQAYSWMKLQRENGKRLSEDIHSCFEKQEVSEQKAEVCGFCGQD
jgi:transposase